MFYSQFILAKKGPLGTIWIAAHLERKLRKNQVADTDIGVSVDSIIFPEVPIALRLSSHLLLGVVRIYSKKVNYLFHDCSEALLKIKQAFRSTAVDLPPEESTAPYHSITLPETFHLDDFELPDSAFQGDFVDHHVSTKEQITLQDTLDGAVFSTMQFGLDERFGDGNASHIGLYLDEDLFLEKHASPKVDFLTLPNDERALHPGQSSSPFPGSAMDVDDNQNGFIETKVEEPEQFTEPCHEDDDEPNFTSIAELKRNDGTSTLQGFDIRTPDLNLLFFQNDHPEVPLGATEQNGIETAVEEIPLPECAHAPSTPGLLEETFSANMPESPALSPQHKPSSSNIEVGIKTNNSSLQPECLDSSTNNSLMGVVMGPHSLEAGNAESSPASLICEKVSDVNILAEKLNEQNNADGRQADYANSELKEHHIEDTENKVETLFFPSVAQLECFDSATTNNALMRVVMEPRSLDAENVESSPASVICERVAGLTILDENLNEQNNAYVLLDEYVNSELKDPHIDDGANKEDPHIDDGANKEETFVFPAVAQLEINPVPAETGALIENIPDASMAEPPVTCHTTAQEKDPYVEVPDELLGRSSYMSKVTNEDCLYEKSDTTRAESVQYVTNTEVFSPSLQPCGNQPDHLIFFSSREFAEPEKMLLAPPACVNQANDLSRVTCGNQLDHLICFSSRELAKPEKMLLAPPAGVNQAFDLSQVTIEKPIIESDGSVNKITNLSGKKRRLMESASLLQDDNSAKNLSRQRIRKSTDYVPNDDDLLASILVGKGTPLLRIAPTPPATVPSSKNPRVTKRKVVMDDASILHADVIRQQLINTGDIRRIRKKAPCTRPDIWFLERNALGDDLFDESMLTGVSTDLSYLHTRGYDFANHQRNDFLKKFDVSGGSELVTNTNDKEKNNLSSIIPEKTERQGPAEESISADCQSRKGSDECIAQEHLVSATDLPQVELSNGDLQSTMLATGLKEPEKIAEIDVISQGQVTSHDLIADEAQQIVANQFPNGGDVQFGENDEAFNVGEGEPQSMFINDNALPSVQNEGACATTEPTTPLDILAAMESGNNEAMPPSADNHLLEQEPAMPAIVPGTSSSPRIGDIECDGTVLADVSTDHEGLDVREGMFDAEVGADSLVQKEIHNEAMPAIVPGTSSSPRIGDIECDGTVLADVTTDHEGLDVREGMFDAEVGADSLVQKDIHNEKNHIATNIFSERLEMDASSLAQPSSDNGNFPSTVGEDAGFQENNMDGGVVVESTPLDLTGAKEFNDFGSTIDGNDTEFLNVDDEIDYDEEAEYDESDPQDARSLENSGWSSRTRGVARYLQTIFDEENGLGKKDVTVDRLIAGKTRKEASRMFFESLVLKTKDYIHVEQDNPFDCITIKPKTRLLKSEF